MAKANNRKRANGKVKVDMKQVVEPQRLNPLAKAETQYFEELVGSSSQYAEVLSKRDQYRTIVQQLKESRTNIQKDKIKLPVNITLIPNVMTYPESDKKEVLKIFDGTIQNYQKALQALESKVTYLYEAFVESGIRNKEYFIRRFAGVQAKQITPGRVTLKDEKTLFEAEIDDLINDPKKKEEVKKAVKAAAEHNKKLTKDKVKR